MLSTARRKATSRRESLIYLGVEGTPIALFVNKLKLLVRVFELSDLHITHPKRRVKRLHQRSHCIRNMEVSYANPYESPSESSESSNSEEEPPRKSRYLRECESLSPERDAIYHDTSSEDESSDSEDLFDASTYGKCNAE